METVELLSPEELQALKEFQKASERLDVLSLGAITTGATFLVMAILSTFFVPIVQRATVGSDHPVSRFIWAIGIAFSIGWVCSWFILRPQRLRGMAERNAARLDPLYHQARRKLAEIDKKLAPMKMYLSDE